MSIPPRSIAGSPNTLNSVLVVDTPGFQDPSSVGRQGASFQDLCHNYAQERLHMLHHDATFTSQATKYAQVRFFLHSKCYEKRLNSLKKIFGKNVKEFEK